MDQVIIGLNDNWKFHYGDVPEAWYRGYDDSSWEDIFLPHDWSVHMPFEKTYSSGTGYLAGGVSWYRVRFALPKEYAGKCVRVVFDGIYKNSRIWCNSFHLGKRPYGYSEISYDITDFVRFGDTDNEISVQVMHTDLADSRWFTGSGIYRKAYLVVEEKVHPALHGTFFRTLSLTSDRSSAEISAQTEIVNTEKQPRRLLVRWRLADEDGKTAVCWETKACIEAGENKTVGGQATLDDPVLWSMEHPYLYTLTTELSVENGEVWTAAKDRVGVRMAVFDPDRGFFLNDVEQKLKGVCVHHDGGCLGAAMYKEVWLRRLLKLKEAGCNAIRMSHNPHMSELYELCDELGFAVMDEAFDEWENPKNKWSTGHNVYPPKHQGYAEDFPQWYEADLTDLVKRDRNHPSVIMWSIGNEIDYPNDPYCHPYFDTMTGNNDANKPAAERRYDPDKPDAERLSVIAARLSLIVKRLDDSRPVTLAAAFPELSSQIGFFDELDVVGYNYKEHLYLRDHMRFPDKPLLGSENSHSYAAWRAVTDHRYISGQFLWTGIDYLGEAHGWPVHGSGAGILDLAGNEKPGYYRRKVFWSKEPCSCLLTAPWTDQDGEWVSYRASWNYKQDDTVMVRCFASEGMKEAELFLNGISIGKGVYRQAYGCFEWKVAWEAGVLEAVCCGNSEPDKEAGELRCRLETTGPAARLEARIWKSAYEKTSSELFQIEISLLDTEGRLVSDDDAEITVDTVHAVLLGLENGDLADLTPYSSKKRKTHGGRLIAYVRPDSWGRPGITVSCEKLKETVTVL